MPPLLRTALLAGALLAAAFAGATLLATEGGEVVVLETRAPDGAPRRTRVWVADHGGRPWIEIANPERPFWDDIRRDPNVRLERGGETRTYVAVAFPSPQGRARIRALLREKYGWADRWLQAVVDTSDAIALRLDPAPVPAR